MKGHEVEADEYACEKVIITGLHVSGNVVRAESLLLTGYFAALGTTYGLALRYSNRASLGIS